MAPSVWSACASVWMSVVVASSVFLLPVRYEIKVEVLLVVGLWLRFLQGILGPMRRISGEQNLQYAAMAAYYLPSFLAFSAAGSLSSSSSYYIMWCLLLLMISAFGRTEMRVYTLTAGANQRWVLLRWMLYLCWVQAVGLVWTDQKFTLCGLFCSLLSFVWFLGTLSAKPQVGNLATNIKPYAEYMEREYNDIVVTMEQEANNNSITMFGIKYPAVPGSDGLMVTIGNITRRSSRRVMTRDDEDMMLAYSYSNLLARRYFGFHCPEENCVPVRHYALAQLQQQGAFEIIEAQLAFLHDYFFASYGHIVWSSCTCCLCGEEEIMTKLPEITSPLRVVFIATVLMVWAYRLFIAGGTFGAHKAAFHGVASLLLVLNQWYCAKPVVPFYWDSIRNAFWKDCVSAHKFVRWCRSPHFCSRTHQQPYWQEKIGQYSLMEDYDRISWKNTIVALFKEHVLGQEVSHNLIEHYPAEEDPVSLKPSLKQSVAGWLLVTQGRPPTNGKTSLGMNGVLVDFGSTLKEETHHTHTILIWHIATWYSSEFLKVQRGDYSHAQVAQALSKYCAYLVAFLPELLPVHSLDAKKALQQVIEMAKYTLGTTRMTMNQKHKQIRRLFRGEEEEEQAEAEEEISIYILSDEEGHTPPSENLPEEQHDTNLQGLQQSPPDDESSLNTFKEGINLGLQLVERDSVDDINEGNHVSSWKVMADFWTETILYIAPSENAAAHIEQLAKGGEFVTHLWALLSNAGIYKRAS